MDLQVTLRLLGSSFLWLIFRILHIRESQKGATKEPLGSHEGPMDLMVRYPEFVERFA